MNINNLFAVTISIMLHAAIALAQQASVQEKPPQISSTPLVYGERHMLPSEILGETRAVDVYLPESYYEAAQTRAYPLIVVLDGEFMFHTVTGVVKHLSSVSRMPEAIVVGIPNNTGKRLSFSPKLFSDNGRQSRSGGQEEQYIQFFKEELFPFLNKKYRTVKFRMLIGLSPTAKFTLHTFWKAPDLFQAHIAIVAGHHLSHGYKPEESLSDVIQKSFTKTPNRKAYLYINSAESNFKNNPKVKTNLENIEKQLLPYTSKSLTLKTEVVPGVAYAVVLPSVISAMDMIFPKEKWEPDYNSFINQKGTATSNMDAFFKNLSSEYGFKIFPKGERFWNSDCLQGIGYRLLRQERIKEAIEIFQRWVEYYPNTANAYDSLAEALEADNRLEEALEVQEKAVVKAKRSDESNLALFETHLQQIKDKVANLPKKN
ncbi:hypothetical protein JYT44_00245 [Caldithrix abyssi]|nr:hypothetical protein [Caldithrix abyssi]